MSNNPSQLKIIQINIRSINNKRDLLEHYIDYNMIDIAISNQL